MLKNVTGFDQREHCERCLEGNLSKIIATKTGRYPAGFTAEGKIEKPEPYVYLCAVTPPGLKDISHNVHILMERDDKLAFTYEDDNIFVSVTGMCRIKINPLPPDDQEILRILGQELYSRCRNFQAGWQLFPANRKPFVWVPGVNSSETLKPAVVHRFSHRRNNEKLDIRVIKPCQREGSWVFDDPKG